jgi:hypothetical protein
VATHAEIAKSFWTRSARHWPDEEKLLGLYILSGPHSTSEGYYRLPLGYIVDDLGWGTEQVSTTMQSLAEREFVHYDLDAQVVFVCKRLEYRQPRGEKQVRGAVNVVREVPPSPLLSLFVAAADEHAEEFAEQLHSAFPTLPDTPSIPLLGGICRAGARAPGLSPTPTPTPFSSNNNVSPNGLDGARERLKKGQVQRVFAAWIESTGRTGRTQLDAKRRRVITTALKSYPVEECIAAVRGWRHSPHHRGETNGTTYNDIELLLRNSANIEKFRDLELGSHTDDSAAFVASMAARAGR